MSKTKFSPIGIFDSGYGGLTVLREIVKELPEYDFLYLGDNARAPYGTRSFATIYDYTLEAVEYLFFQNCPLVILACNTASARALRNIQQKNLPNLAPGNRVLGIIRPTAEVIGYFTETKKVGVMGTPGTIASESYILEIKHQFPEVEVFQQACPLWVPLVESGETEGEGAEYFVKEKVRELTAQNKDIDTVLLGCTHYPLLLPLIEKYMPPSIRILTQGDIVAKSLADYLKRHPEMEKRLSKKGKRQFLTTGSTEEFEERGALFFGQTVQAAESGELRVKSRESRAES